MRSLVLSEATNELLVANYFSDTVTVLDAGTGEIRATISLGAPQEMSDWRKGELMANDGPWIPIKTRFFSTRPKT